MSKVGTPGFSAGVAEQDTAPGSSADRAEQDPVFVPESVDTESFLEPSDPVDSRGRGTYDPFA